VRPGRAADHSPPSSAADMEEQSYTSTHPLGHTGPVTGKLIYIYIYTYIYIHICIYIVYSTLLNVWCRSLLPCLHCVGHGVVDNM